MDCPSCRAPNPPGARFCLNCGTPLAPPRAPEGERRFITVLFADVVGSTALGELVDPERVAEIMNGAFGFMNAATAQYGGTVSRLMGDAVLALFGAPIAHEDDAERAVRAGLAMQEAARDYATVIQRDYGVDFEVRVGINSGLAVLAMVGSEVKTEYTAMGDTANVASRLQNAADPGTILISSETERLVRGAFDVLPRGSLQLKGKSAPVDTFEVTGARADAQRMRGLEGVASPLVGRDDELQAVSSRLTAATNGEGAVVVIVGEAGLGKSRLVSETRQLMTTGTALEGRGLSYGQAIAFYPWRQIIRQAIGAAEIDPPDAVRRRLAEVFPTEDLPFLEAMLSIESTETEEMLANLAGEQLTRSIEAAIRRFILDAAQSGPVYLTFDDLHWADEASLTLLSHLVPLARTAPIVWICILRPDHEARSWTVIGDVLQANDEISARLDLQPLSGNDSQLLLDNLLQIEGMPENVRQLILQKADGNPFFLEEVLRSLIDSGHLIRQDGRWTATKGIAEVAIPDTLAGVLASRIDLLPEETKRVAQTAAVIGRIFRYPVLCATISQAPTNERIADPDTHVSTLTEEELVRERTRNPELEYIFKHALTQEAAYDLLLLRRRKEYHRRVGEVLEDLYPDQVDDLAPMLAHHFSRAEDWARALRYRLRAAREASRVYALREAMEHLDGAYQAVKHMPGARSEDVIDAIVGWAELAIRFNRFEEALERLSEAEPLARSLNDSRRLATVLAWIGNAHVSAGFPSQGIEPLIESYQLAEVTGEDRLTLVPTFLSTMAMVDRDPAAALMPLDDVIDLAARNDRPDIESHALAVKAMALSRLGEFGRAEENLRRAHEVVQRVTAPAKIADVNAVTSLVYFDMGLIERGQDYSQFGAAEALEAGVSECAVYSMYCTALGEIHKRNLDDARRQLEAVMEMIAPISTIITPQPLLRGALAVVKAKAGDPGGIETLEAARNSARTSGDPYTGAVYSEALGEARLNSGDLSGAEQDLDDALAYYQRNAMRPYIVHALSLLADLRDAQGRPNEAAEARDERNRIQAELSEQIKVA